MMQTPSNQLPRLALELRDEFARRFGMCMEVCITAFAAYAQCVENYPPSDDPAYRASGWPEEWLASRTSPAERIEALFAFVKREDAEAALNIGAGI